MKQVTLLTYVACMLLSFTAISQKRTGKNERFCQAEINFMNKQSECYVLSHFSNDSIFVYPLIVNKNKKEMQVDQMLGIKASSIKRIFLRIDKKIIIADSFFNRVSLPVGDSATLTSRTLDRNALRSNKELFPATDLITSSPEASVFLLPVLPVFLFVDIAFLVGSKGKKYSINGKEKKFYRMVNRLTGNDQKVFTELYPTF